MALRARRAVNGRRVHGQDLFLLLVLVCVCLSSTSCRDTSLGVCGCVFDGSESWIWLNETDNGRNMQDNETKPTTRQTEICEVEQSASTRERVTLYCMTFSGIRALDIRLQPICIWRHLSGIPRHCDLPRGVEEKYLLDLLCRRQSKEMRFVQGPASWPMQMRGIHCCMKSDMSKNSEE